MNPRDIIEAMDRWAFEIENDPLANLKAIMEDWNTSQNLGYSLEDIDRDAPLILAWLRDPTVIDPDPDERSDIEWAQYVNRIHG